MVGYIIIALLQTVCSVCRLKNFENRSLVGEDMDESKVARFLLAHGVDGEFSALSAFVALSV